MKKLNKIFVGLVIMFSLFSLFMTGGKFAFGEDLFFTLNTHGYQSGTWTNENVIVDIVYNGSDDVTYEYSLNQIGWQTFNGHIEFDTEGNYFVYFRLISLSVSNSQNINIRLDKTLPVFDMVAVSTFLPTSQDVVITVIASDLLSGGITYKFGLNDWQELNTRNIIANNIFYVGDILIRDRAGNISAYDEIISITNIDKTEPYFTLVANTQNPVRKDTVMFEVTNILSGIKSFTVQLPSGEIADITNTYENGFEVTKNGEYIFTLQSNSGLIKSVYINYNNITGIITTFELLLIICSSFVLIVLSILLTPVIIKKIKLKNKKKIK